MTKKINVVVLSYGSKREYLRAVFCIRSFYAHIAKQFSHSPTLLYTDNPNFFESYLSDLPVVYLFLSAEKISEMRGKDDFIHRIKIAIIEDAFQRSADDMFYVDSDAFFTKDPSSIILNLTGNNSFMHTREYTFESLSTMALPAGAPFRAVLDFLRRGQVTTANGQAQKVYTSLFSWNAGVIVLQKKHSGLLPDVYAITDQLYAATRNHASEQYAFSIVLQANTELGPCDQAVYHYWYRIKKTIIDNFLASRLDVPWLNSSEGTREQLTLKWAALLPKHIENNSLALRDNAVQAFNADDYKSGYFWAARAFMKNPFSLRFLRDVAYHTRRFLLK
jgi:hypothetical protein